MLRQPTLIPSHASPAGHWAASLLAVIMAIFAVAPAAGQSACEIVLREAERSYQAGRIEEVFALREACLRGKATREQKVQTYALLAKVHVALDQLAKARRYVESLLNFNAEYQPDERRDPVQFIRLVNELKGTEEVVTVVSVSKNDEPLREAPATAIVITAEDIQRRGYVDLEAIFHDLPGFDISRGNGETYSSLYQRGFRSARNDRTLFLIDGVEQNDLWSNTAYVSRQIPLSNIERIEIVYGPASTIYGANAYTGVINVITKKPEAFLAADGKYGTDVEIGIGPWNTRFYEMNVAGRNTNRSFSYSIFGRIYESDERDLTGFPDWDFDPSAFAALSDDVYRDALTVEGQGEDGSNSAEAYLIRRRLPKFCNPETDTGCDLYSVEIDEVTGEAIRITPTQAGIDEARRRDIEGYAAGFDLPPSFENVTDDSFIGAKLSFPSLEIGVQFWRREEGSTGWYQDTSRDHGATVPRSTALYLKYFRALTADSSLQLFSRYKLHELDNDTAFTFFRNFSTGDRDIRQLQRGGTAFWLRSELYQSSEQLRNEATFFYEPSQRISLVSSLEIRNSTIQTDAFVTCDEDAKTDICARLGLVSDVGYIDLTQRDFGLMSQLTFRPRNDLKIVAGGRLDYNDIQETGGFGTVFNPRLAIIYSTGELTFRAIYAEAFKDPSNAERFSEFAGLIEERNVDLESEVVENIEITASWQRSNIFSLDAAIYESTYSDVVGLKKISSLFQRQNLGRLKIRGAQLNTMWNLGRYRLTGNYTYTEPFNVNPADADLVPEGSAGKIRIGDIASHRLNLGLDVDLLKNLDMNIRANYVAERPTGPGTTVPTNSAGKVDAYVVANMAVSYRDIFGARGKWQESLQLVVNNILDEEYSHPGVSTAGSSFAARLPQPGRSVFLRLKMKIR